ncbi:phage holin family protein [Patescibacteria group bacterium]
MLRIIGIFFLELVSVLILAGLLPGFNVISITSATVFVIAVGVLNALIRPFLIRATLPITVMTLGIFSLILNGLLILTAVNFIPGVEVRDLFTAIVLSIGLTAVNSFFNAIFAIDDTDSYYRNIIKKQVDKENVVRSKKPGIIFLEIDGLSKSIFARAMSNGYMPTMARWLRNSHKLESWETDLASSTPASQAGILHGDNHNMPAFRWFDRNTQKVISMSDPKSTGEHEDSLNKSSGLLRGGMSVNNMFSGQAKFSVLTASKLMQKGTAKKQKGLYFYFVNPYNFSRSIVLSIVDIIHEIKDAYFQRRTGVEPRLDHRGGKYPIVRAITCIIMRDIATNTVVGDILSGLPSVYATYVAYDEVAHHAGIERSEAMHTLTQLDKQFAKIEKAVSDAPRPYHLVILSDHGQSQGATFMQRFGLTLEDFVKKSLKGKASVYKSKDAGEESVSRVNKMLLQVANEGDGAANRMTKKAMESERGAKILERKTKPAKINKDVVVLASGNLGLIYFTGTKNGLSYEQIKSEYPNLIQNLVAHKGVGFVVVDSLKGDLAIGKSGAYNLYTNEILGENPTTLYGPNTTDHLRRSAGFDNRPDILVMSMYDPQTEEVAAFEELVGSHGGLGGPQNRPFIFYPKSLDTNDLKNVVGAENLHKIIVGWTSL